MKVFVTVGTTSFNALIEAVDSEEVKGALNQLGYVSIICQIGSGTYKPRLEHFDYTDDIEQFIRNSDLVICHGGAGSIMAGLRLGKKVISVVNTELMHNHQIELATELHENHHLLMCTSPSQLKDTVRLI